MSSDGATSGDSGDVLEALGRETYLSLVTYRRDGSERPTPVWVVRDGDRLLVTTAAGTAKVRRARRDPRGTVTPCDQRGRVQPGAPTRAVAVEVSEDPAVLRRTADLLRHKHPIGYRLVSAAHTVHDHLPRRGAREGAVTGQVSLVLRLVGHAS